MDEEFGSFWERKMKTVFERMDTDQDGLMTLKDVELMADLVIKMERLEGNEATAAQEKYLTIFKRYLNSNEQPANFDDYMTKLKKAGKERLRQGSSVFFQNYFTAMDTDQDGMISSEDFLAFSKLFGVSEINSKESFNHIDVDQDGKISMQEFIEAGKNFYSLEMEGDPSQFLYGPLA